MTSTAAVVADSPQRKVSDGFLPPNPQRLDSRGLFITNEAPTSDRNSLPQRDSAKDSTLSPLPNIGLRKVFPGQAKPLLAAPRHSSASELPPSALPSSYQNSAEELERQVVNHDMLLQHFTLRKRSSSNFASPRYPAQQPSLSSAQMRWSFTRSVKRLKRRASTFATGAFDPISPDRWFMTFRQVAVLLVVLFDVFFVPFAGLILTDSKFIAASQSSVQAVHIVVEVVLMTDCVLNFNTALHDTQRGHHVLILRRVDIAKRYVRGAFAFDFFGSLPFECIAALTSNGPLIAMYPVVFHIENALLLLRARCILQVKKMPWFVELLHAASSRGHAWLGVKYVVLQTVITTTIFLLVISHYLACIWHAIVAANAATLAEMGPSSLMDVISIKVKLQDHYFACLLHVVCTIFGHANATGVAIADAFHTLLVIVGVQVFAYFVATLSMLVSNTSYSTHSEFQRKMQSLASKMDKMQLPADLQKRVQQYYAHLWAEYDTLSSDVLDFSRDLTRPLALEVGLYRYMHLVMRVPFWSDCSPDFVSALILNLQVRVFLRDDYVVRRGEIGTEMFMIHRGVGERTGTRREAVRLTNGNYFAEIAVLMDYKRATSVRALTHMELCVLDRLGLHKILARYHRDRRRVVTRIVRAGLEHRDYPEMWQDVVLIGARRSRRESEKHREGAVRVDSSGGQAALGDEAAEEELSPADAAELLVEAMNIDGRYDSPLLLNGSLVSKSKRRQSNVESDERLHKQAIYSSLYSQQINNSSMSSNGRRIERLRKTRPVIIRSQEPLTVTRTTDEPSAGPPSTTDPQLSTRVLSGLEMMRSGSNRSIHSTASAARSTRSVTSCRAVDTESIPVNTLSNRESMDLLQDLTEMMTRLEQRTIQMEERASPPLLRLLRDPLPRGDDETVIDLKLSLNSRTSGDRVSASSSNHTDIALKERQPRVRLRDKHHGSSLRRLSVGHKSSSVEEQDSNNEVKLEHIHKHRRSMSLSASSHTALVEWQSQFAIKIAGDSTNASGARAKRYAASTLADALWKSDQQ